MLCFNVNYCYFFSDRVEKGEPPMFLKKIGDNEVMEGMTAKFTACITGIPTPDVSWYVHKACFDIINRCICQYYTFSFWSRVRFCFGYLLINKFWVG